MLGFRESAGRAVLELSEKAVTYPNGDAWSEAVRQARSAVYEQGSIARRYVEDDQEMLKALDKINLLFSLHISQIEDVRQGALASIQELNRLSKIHPQLLTYNRRTLIEQVEKDGFVGLGPELDFTLVKLSNLERIRDSIGVEKKDELLRLVIERAREYISESVMLFSLSPVELMFVATSTPKNRENLSRSIQSFKVPMRSGGLMASLTYSASTLTAKNFHPMPFSSLYNSLASRLGEPQGMIESIHVTETPKDSKWNSAMKALNKKVASGELEPRLEMAVEMHKMELKQVELKTPLRELSRLNSEDKTPIDPILSSGLFLKIENHELKHARALSERLKVEVAVNVAPVSIVDKDLLERKIQNLQGSELSARLVLEISERYLMNFEPQELQSAVRRLKRHGVRVGLDEVGRGFSSFQLLHEVEFSHMKISPELYRDELGLNRGGGLVKHIVSMANSLGIVLSATGISSQEECLALLDMGVALQQGSYVSKLLFGTDKVKLSELPVLFKDGFTDYLNL